MIKIKIMPTNFVKKQNKIIQMTREHRRLQDNHLKEYQNREKEFMRRIQEEWKKDYDDEEEEEEVSIIHG